MMDNTNLDALQTEVDFYRQNQTVVEEEIKTLITDNENLSRQVSMLLKERLDNARQTDNDSNEYGKELEDLRKQVALSTKERDSLQVLWQTSQKTIDALENELKTYQSYNNGSPNKIADKRDLELKLETALTDYLELETKLKEIHTKLNTLEEENKKKNQEIISYKERGKELEDSLKQNMKLLEDHRINLAVEKKNNELLKDQIVLCQKECVNKIKKEAEAKTKVAEALQLYDVVSAQKNEAYKTIQDLTKELTEQKQLLDKVKRETETFYRKEIEDIKDKYNEKVADMLQHIRNLDAELVQKGLLLNKALRENKILQEINQNHIDQQQKDIKVVHPKLALAEQRLEAMFQELVSSERRNIQLVCEKQCLAIDIQRIQDIQAREAKRRDWEEKLLKTQCDELRIQVEHLQKSLDETHRMVNKLQDMLASRTELNQKMVSSKEEELMELNKHLENQMELSKKWKESYLEMSNNLKRRLEETQKENRELRIKLQLPQIESNQDESSAS